MLPGVDEDRSINRGSTKVYKREPTCGIVYRQYILIVDKPDHDYEIELR